MGAMNETTDAPAAPVEPPPADALDTVFRWLRGLGLRRDGQDKWLGGVCSGLADRLRVDPLVVRAGFIALLCLAGFGITAYLIALALLPDDDDEIIAERAIRHGDGWGITLLVVIGISLFSGPAVTRDFGLWWTGGWLIPLAVVVWIIVRHRRGLPIIPSQPARTTTPTATTTGSGPVAPAHPSGYAVAHVGEEPAPGPTPPGPPPGPAAEQTAAQPRPPRRSRRRRTGGFAAVLLTLGLAAVAFGIGVLLDGPVGFPGDSGTLGLIGATAAVGFVILALGLSGRRAGFSGVVALCVAVVTAGATLLPSVNPGAGVGDRVWTPTATSTQTTYALGLGDATLDLTRLPVDPSTPLDYKASLGLGDMTVIVPTGLTVDLRAHVGLGEIRDDGRVVASTDRRQRDYRTTIGTGAAELVLAVDLGAGSLTIEHQDAS